MIRIKYLILCLFGFLLGLSACSKEERGINEEPDPDYYDTPEFYSIEYDFSKKRINQVQNPEFKESFENNSDWIIPISIFPYLDQGSVEFTMGEIDNFLDGLECEVPVPDYENDAWSETQTKPLKTVFGETTSFNPFNGNVSFTINADPWETIKYSFILTFSELTVPFKAIFIGSNYGVEYSCSGILTIKVPINCEIKIEDIGS